MSEHRPTNGPRIKFKGPKAQAERLAGEWPCLNKVLQLAILDLGNEMWKQWRVDLVITCLKRTKAENAKLRGAHPRSLHMSDRAADIRSRDLTKDRRWALKQYFDKMHLMTGLDFVIESNHFHVEADRT